MKVAKVAKVAKVDNSKEIGKDVTSVKGITPKANNKRRAPSTESGSESESEDPYVYQTNCYFACFYPDTVIAKVLEIASKNPTYAAFTGPTAQVTSGSSCLFISTNSDIEGDATLGFVSSASLTVESNEFEYPNDAWVDINIAQLEKIERKYAADINLVTLFYELVVREFKKQKIPLTGLYCGWRTISCSWELPE